MNIKKRKSPSVTRFSDALLPGSLLIAALLGREAVALCLFTALYAVKLCSLAAADGLRAAFARQPSMRYVQGSALLALLLQIPGAAVAALISRLSGLNASYLPFIACGLLLNIEHVFYEYLFAAGDGRSATLCRGITALLTLAGLLLCAPPAAKTFPVGEYEAVFLLIPCAASALVGLSISLASGGRLRPKLNAEVLRRAPASLLRTLLFPALAIIALALLKPEPFTALPLFAGLTLYAPCCAPFRRTPSESAGMNRLLLAVCGAAVICAVIRGLTSAFSPNDDILLVCGGILLAALCAFALFGNARKTREE